MTTASQSIEAPRQSDGDWLVWASRDAGDQGCGRFAELSTDHARTKEWSLASHYNTVMGCKELDEDGRNG